MIQHQLYCGHQSSAMSEEETATLIRELAMQYFGNGHTLISAEGRWQGVMVQCNEPTTIVEVWEANGFGTPDLGGFVREFKNLAAQESVVLISHSVDATVF